MGMAKYDPNRPANDVAKCGEGCSVCGRDITQGAPVYRAPLNPQSVRHPFDCYAVLGPYDPEED